MPGDFAIGYSNPTLRRSADAMMNRSRECSSLEQFCGSPFWDADLLDSADPDVTSCFQQTVLVWVPCLYLWIVAPLYLRQLRMRSNNKVTRKMSRRHLAKTTLAAIMLVVTLLELFKAVGEFASEQDIAAVQIVRPLHLAVTVALAGILIQYEEEKGLQSPGLLFTFWLLSGLCGAVTARSKVRQMMLQESVEDKFRFVTFSLYFSMTVLQLAMSAVSGADRGEKDPSPEESSSFLSRMTFWWFTPFLQLGYKRPLTATDLYPLRKEDTSQHLVPTFHHLWQNELLSNEKSKAQHTDKDDTSEGKDKRTTWSLFAALFRCFWPLVTVTALFHAAGIILNLTWPQLLKLLIGFTKDKDEYQWKGYLYTALLMTVTVSGSLVGKQFVHRCKTLNLRLKTVLTSAVYKKSLTVTSEARKSFTVGSITNLMSVDAQRVADTCFDLQFVWSMPFQLAGSMYVLWRTLGLTATLAGVAASALLAPIHSWMVSKMKELERTVMEQKDARTKLMTEVLNGMKVLKLYAWELSFKAKIDAIRAKELKAIQHLGYTRAGLAFLGNFTSPLVSFAIFAAYVLTDENNVLDAEKAFMVHTLMGTLQFSFHVLPHVYINIVQAKVSLGRIEDFLRQDELSPDNVRSEMPGPPISVDDGTFSWGREEEPILKDINLCIPDGALVAVIGQIGSGKSSLLSALLGEMEKRKGDVSVRGSTAYVCQQPWIQNATLQDNILFDSPMDACRYSAVLESCALGPDLEMLSGGDLTEIGEKGINLSGGQKQRVSLARAAYSGADVYYLDDPLSAVDPHVGRHIFNHVIGPDGLLKNKTRVLVTHGTSFLPQCDQVIVLQGGRVWLRGDYSSLMEQSREFAEYIRTYSNTAGGQSDSEMDKTEVEKDPPVHLNNLRHDSNGKVKDLTGTNGLRKRLQKPSRDRLAESRDQEQSEDIKTPGASVNQIKQKEEGKGSKLLQEEEEEQSDGVKLSVLGDYIRSFGTGLFLCMSLLCCGQLAADKYSVVWLSEWTSDGTRDTSLNYLRLGGYGALGLAQGVLSMLVHICVVKGAVLSAMRIHDKALLQLLRGSLQFFDVTPLGRILSRFSQDQERIDRGIGWLIMLWVFFALMALSTLFIVSFSTPLLVVMLLPIAYLYLYMQRYYNATSRQLRRLESKSSTLIHSHFSETLQGVSTIRAYSRCQQFVRQNHARVDQHQTAFYSSSNAENWLGVGLDMAGNAITMFAALLAILGRDSLSPGAVGLSLSSALSIDWILTTMVHIIGHLERNVVSLERLQQYAQTPAEADWTVEDHRPPDNWPAEGNVSLSSYQTRYRDGLDLVIKDITVNISSGEKIGIVGRTGAGKSSLVLAIFRIIEAAGGEIVIDGVNISTIGLHDLRSRITVIPQDPVVFSGTLRMNLDPFEKHPDAEIWRALELAHLKDFIMGLDKQLDHDVSEGGTNLSVGQRQLVCLARALLRKSKLLVLDEATASVDPETDALVQTTIRTQFADCTVLTIAHRLNTIMDSTRILVLDGGKVAEFDTPENLIGSKGLFSSMVRDAGLATQG
ncbi:multidrug resistance-associated protein 1-like [Branchiostoma lanceolatum]|uniref:multidrug resistance-associated protein 1-like n=1 Tax=Branchiostoma lanceolatum TaxID=7740 RepID=UPI003454CB4D